MADPDALVVCVPNFSEGRRADVIAAICDALASAPGARLVYRQGDPPPHPPRPPGRGPPAPPRPVSRAARAALPPERASLAEVRRGEYEGLREAVANGERLPDHGPHELGRGGAPAGGGRQPL